MVLRGLKGGSGAGDWTNTSWLHVPFWEFLGYSSKLCGLDFSTSLAINQVEVILKAPLMETHMWKRLMGWRCDCGWGGRAYCPESSRMLCLTLWIMWQTPMSDSMPLKTQTAGHIPSRWSLLHGFMVKRNKVRSDKHTLTVQVNGCSKLLF